MPRIDKYALLPGWPAKVSYKFALPYLAAWQGCKLSSRLPGVWGSWANSITWLEREILPGYITLEYSLKRPMVMDVDDAIWLSRPFGRKAVAKIAARADVIVAGNRFLADWFSHYNQNVRIVPTAVDLERYRPRSQKERDYSSKFVIGWTGTSGNLKYLYAIETPLKRFMDNHLSAEILVIADEAPTFKQIPMDRMQFVPWSVEVEASEIQRMDVGIMPLSEDEWSRGKCSFKVLQYMACAVPVIVTPVGMNAELLALGGLGLGAACDDDWYDGLAMLYANTECSRRMGMVGRSMMEAHFSRDVVTAKLAEIFKGLA
jgi:glycosyltransferase involved in cell wall biosynthesis